MASKDVSLVVPRMTLMASFCSSRVSAGWPVTGLRDPDHSYDPEYHTRIHEELMTLFVDFCRHGFYREQSFLAPEFC